MQSHVLARKTTDVGGVLPRSLLIDGITEQLVGVREHETGDGITSGVLKFDSQVAGRGCGVVQ